MAETYHRDTNNEEKNLSGSDPIFDYEVQSALLSHFGLNNEEGELSHDITEDVIVDCNLRQNIINFEYNWFIPQPRVRIELTGFLQKPIALFQLKLLAFE